MSVERHEEPVDELGRLANEMLIHLETLVPEDSKVRCVVFLEDNERCVSALGGWDSDMNAVAAVFAHMAAVFEANGKKLMIVPIGQG
jgi:hypothetical protein